MLSKTIMFTNVFNHVALMLRRNAKKKTKIYTRRIMLIYSILKCNKIHGSKMYIEVHACCLLFVVAVCWLSPGEAVMPACCCSAWLGVDPNPIEMPQERLCCNVLGEDVGRICHRVDLDDSHHVVEHQPLDEEVLQLDVFGFLWWADSCCHALSARGVRVNLDVDLLLAECFRQEASNV